MKRVIKYTDQKTLADTLSEHRKFTSAICVLIILNALKITLFDFIILPVRTPAAFAYKFAFALLVSVIIIPLALRIRFRLVLILLYVAQSAYIFSYMSYYAYFGNYLHLFQAFALFTEGVGPIRHFTIPVNYKMAVLLIDLPVFILLLVHKKGTGSYLNSIKKPLRVAVSVSIAALLLIECWNYANGLSVLQLGKNFYSTEEKIIERYGTFTNNIVDITVNYGGANMINQFRYGKAEVPASTTEDHPNIVAIQVEAMDAGIVNQEYGGDYVMPYLHSLTQKAVYYPYMLSYHKSGGTSDAEFSILNSIEPLGNYPSIKIPIYSYPNSFVKQLNKGGYATEAFHGNIGNYYNRDVAFQKMGFDNFFDIGKMKLKESGWGAPDHEVYDFATKNTAGLAKPFFDYIITMSSHMPFENTAGYYKNDKYADITDKTVRNYFTAMSYVDQSIRDFADKITKLHPDTYILVWGDHTPGIESEEYKQASFTSDGDYYEFVPFIMLTPDKRTYREEKNAASFLDIAPTILDAAGIAYSYRTDGIDLAAPPEKLPEIPFKGKFYSRAELFDNITRK
ncbi:MAG TPA: LTA synthase family protein [Clostridia bacterium]|nr:LTA synthase family protein [Clostridia bacterium]